MTDGPPTKGQPSLGEAALFGLCPRCGARTLFASGIRFADRCSACGLDYSRFNVGDGPAAFLTLIIGGVVTGLAIWLDIAVQPPFWVHALLWIPLTVAAVWFGLRGAKAALLYSEFHRGAAEAGSRPLDDRPPDEPS